MALLRLVNDALSIAEHHLTDCSAYDLRTSTYTATDPDATQFKVQWVMFGTRSIAPILTPMVRGEYQVLSMLDRIVELTFYAMADLNQHLQDCEMSYSEVYHYTVTLTMCDIPYTFSIPTFRYTV